MVGVSNLVRSIALSSIEYDIWFVCCLNQDMVLSQWISIILLPITARLVHCCIFRLYSFFCSRRMLLSLHSQFIQRQHYNAMIVHRHCHRRSIPKQRWQWRFSSKIITIFHQCTCIVSIRMMSNFPPFISRHVRLAIDVSRLPSLNKVSFHSYFKRLISPISSNWTLEYGRTPPRDPIREWSSFTK